MQSSNTIYFIVDYTAIRKYFHQHALIIGLSHFLFKNGHSPEILIPTVADRGEIEHASGNVSFILDSGYSSRKSKLIRHFIHLLLRITGSSDRVDNRIKKFLRRTYIKSGLNHFRQIDKNKEIHIIFPTLDPLSLELALQISKDSKMKNYFFYFRIVGSESRGLLTSNNELQTLLELVKLYPQYIRIGVETNGYRYHLENLGFNSNIISWSPWPCLENFDKSKLKKKEILIGFLGCAKQRKGFDNIPEILTNLKTEGLYFNILIQEANFPWVSYKDTKEKILKIMDYEFEFLSSNLDLANLQKYINKCDLLILPYDSDSYSINASGILYHACDSNVPVLTASGVGFASEIEEFNLGLTYDNLDEIPNLVQKILLMKFGFDDYNSIRNHKTYNFLLK
jgi:hypothetical protein